MNRSMFDWKYFNEEEAESYFVKLFGKSTQEARLDIYQFYRELTSLDGLNKFKKFISKFQSQLLDIFTDLTYIDTCFNEDKKLNKEGLKEKDIHTWVHINVINYNLWIDKIFLVVLEFSKMFDNNQNYDLNDNWSIGAYLSHFNKINVDSKYKKIEEFNNIYLKTIAKEVNKFRKNFNHLKHNIVESLKDEERISYKDLFNFWYVCEHFLWPSFESIFSIKDSSVTCTREVCSDMPLIKSYQYIKDGVKVERYKWKVDDDLILDEGEWKSKTRSYNEIYLVNKEKAIDVMMKELNKIMESKLEKDKERAHVLIDVIYKFNKMNKR